MGSHDDNLYAIYPNGTEKWRFHTGGAVVSSPAIGSDGIIYVGSNDWYLYSLYPNGTMKWRFRTLWAVKPSPVIGDDGTIYAGSWDGRLYALYPNGTLKWKTGYYGSINVAPAIGRDGTIYVPILYEKKLIAINPDGTEKWVFKASGDLDSSPTIGSDGTIYLGCGGGKMYAINHDGTLKWKAKLKSDRDYDGCDVGFSSAIGLDGTIYIGTWFYGEQGRWGYLHAIGGGCIDKPKHGYLYIADREIIPTLLGNTIIIGKITVEPYLQDIDQIYKVEFYIDDVKLHTDTTPPYEWLWDKIVFGKHSLKVMGYYDTGDIVNHS